MTTHTKTLIALLGIIVGVVVAEKSAYATEFAIWSLGLGIMHLMIYFVSKFLANKRTSSSHAVEEVSRFSIPLACGIFFIALFVMILRVQLVEEKSNFVCDTSCTFTGVVLESPKIKNEYQMLTVRPDDRSDVYDVQVRAPLYPRLRVGEHISLTGKVTPPDAVLPHDGEETFDYGMYLRTHDIGSEMFYPKIVLLASTTDELPFVTRLQRLREYFVETISMYVNEPASSLASGMLFGARSMSSELTDTFRAVGISHIVVLSGFNIAILIGFVLLVLVFVPLFLRVILASALVVIFVLMVGGEASIIRATLMSFVGLLALILGRGYVARQALLLSLIIIVLVEPIHLLHDVSLHLSFLATAGIVYLSDGIKKMLYKIRSTSYREIMTTTIAAYAATLPYVMYTFGTVSVYALLTNLIVLPFVPLMMLVTFLVVMFAPISHVLTILVGYVDTLFGNFIIFVAHLVEGLPFSSVTVSVSLFGMYFLYLILGTIYTYLTYRYKKKSRDETLPTKRDEIISGVISY